MIKIGIPRLENRTDTSRVVADVTVDGVSSQLWFEVSPEYGDYLCFERSDAFVLGLLHYAMRKGHDIVSEGPMTKRLYEQLNEQFLPAYYKINRNASLGVPYSVKITAPLAPELSHQGEAVGTGLSCGVDSLHVFAAHPEVTHACVWNLHGVVPDDSKKDVRDLSWNNLKNQGVAFTSYTKLHLLVGNTNYDRGCIPDMQFDGSTTYGNLFCAFCLQKLWSKYYVASGYDIDQFSLCRGVREDPAHYEYLLFAFCSLANFRMLIDGAAQNRLEKVGDLIHYEPSKHFLNVCWGVNKDNRNCSFMCPKCMRTMLNLDCWNALDAYKEVFDVAYYHNHQEQFLAELYRGLIQHSPFAIEMKDSFSKRNYPIGIRIKAWLIVFHKAAKKILRFGKTSQRFSPV